MSTLYVDNLAPNLGSQVEIPDLKPLAGSVVQAAASGNSTFYNVATTSFTTIGAITFTPKFPNSILHIQYLAAGMSDSGSGVSQGMRIRVNGSTITQRTRTGYTEGTWNALVAVISDTYQCTDTAPLTIEVQLATEGTSARIGDSDSGLGSNVGDQHKLHVWEIAQ